MTDNKIKLEAVAQESVQRNGLKALSFRQLADEVGIKSSSVHYYFPEKSDLAQVLIERYVENMSDTLNAINLRPWPLRKKLTAFIGIFESVAKDNRFCLCGMLAAEVEMLSDDNRRFLSDAFTDIELWLTRLFDANQDQLLTSLSSEKFSKAVLSGLEGALLIDRVMGNSRRLKAQKELVLSQVSTPESAASN